MDKLLNKHLKQRTMGPPGNCIPVSAEERNFPVGYSPPQFRWLWAEQQQLSFCVDFPEQKEGSLAAFTSA